MPPVSLVVCLYRERDLLRRLLEKAEGCYDDLVVIHDGPEYLAKPSASSVPAEDFSTAESNGLTEVYHETIHKEAEGLAGEIIARGGRYFEGPRSFQQETHWPFAWRQARHDWVLRLDADEYPSPDLAAWLREFRSRPQADTHVAGYTCVWPLWNGVRAVTNRWPAGRLFLFKKSEVRFFGMVEQIPICEGATKELPLLLNHEPRRKSFGIANVVFRQQAYDWRNVIARSLLSSPTDLPRWRWSSEKWPDHWEKIRATPILTGTVRLIAWTLRGLRDQWRAERRVFPSAALNGALHHFLISLQYWRLIRRQNQRVQPA
jgi:hypothetical protein